MDCGSTEIYRSSKKTIRNETDQGIKHFPEIFFSEETNRVKRINPRHKSIKKNQKIISEKKKKENQITKTTRSNRIKKRKNGR